MRSALLPYDQVKESKRQAYVGKYLNEIVSIHVKSAT